MSRRLGQEFEHLDAKTTNKALILLVLYLDAHCPARLEHLGGVEHLGRGLST
jgi:hypothetical protein